MSPELVVRWNVPPQSWSRHADKLVVIFRWKGRSVWIFRFPRWPWFHRFTE